MIDARVNDECGSEIELRDSDRGGPVLLLKCDKKFGKHLVSVDDKGLHQYTTLNGITIYWSY